MKTPEQLKGRIRSMAAKRNLRAQEVLQMFLFERILERLANSKYKKNFILKDWKDILKDLREEPQMYLLWDNYIAENRYIGKLEFHVVLDTLEEVAEALNF